MSNKWICPTDEKLKENLAQIQSYAETIIEHCMEVYGRQTGYGKIAKDILKCAKEASELIVINIPKDAKYASIKTWYTGANGGGGGNSEEDELINIIWGGEELCKK